MCVRVRARARACVCVCACLCVYLLVLHSLKGVNSQGAESAQAGLANKKVRRKKGISPPVYQLSAPPGTAICLLVLFVLFGPNFESCFFLFYPGLLFYGED